MLAEATHVSDVMSGDGNSPARQMQWSWETLMPDETPEREETKRKCNKCMKMETVTP
jgi:hypothetical protein